jgi:hypothetical protein
MKMRKRCVLPKRQHRFMLKCQERIHVAPAHTVINKAALLCVRFVIAEPAEPAVAKGS